MNIIEGLVWAAVLLLPSAFLLAIYFADTKGYRKTPEHRRSRSSF